MALVNDSYWLDEKPEMMKKIPPEEERVAFFLVRREQSTSFRAILGIMGILSVSLFLGGRHGSGPMIDLGVEGRIGIIAFVLVVLAWLYFLGRNEKGHVDIYPEMIVFYDYDHERKEARPSHFYYWKDIVQYNKAEPYIWFGSVENDPVYFAIRINLLFPYLEKYAPHAEAICCNMKDYFEKKQKGQE